MIKAVIFDMDGLMFDTERIWATLWEPALAALGLPYKEGQLKMFFSFGKIEYITLVFLLFYYLQYTHLISLLSIHDP